MRRLYPQLLHSLKRLQQQVFYCGLAWIVKQIVGTAERRSISASNCTLFGHNISWSTALLYCINLTLIRRDHYPEMYQWSQTTSLLHRGYAGPTITQWNVASRSKLESSASKELLHMARRLRKAHSGELLPDRNHAPLQQGPSHFGLYSAYTSRLN